MDEFSLGKYLQSSLLILYSDRNEIQLDPPYQRIGGIWTREKRQLLLDSLLNGFDVPKLYFHEFVPPKQIGGKKYRYAIIDGKQRLQTIWDYINGDMALADDFEYLRDTAVQAGGLTYADLATKYPQIKSRFDATALDVVTIRTSDTELIEDMFSRLNEAVPLNAPEKRNAFGGPLPAVIRQVSGHAFFTKHIPFADKRYRHRDLAAKFLYLEFANGIVNTKKPDLDAFVRDFRDWREAGLPKAANKALTTLKTEAELTLQKMASIFAAKDSLLRQVGLITLYFHLFRFVRLGRVGKVTREMLKVFEKEREENRRRVEETSETDDAVNARLLEFDKHSQTPNDAYALRIRLSILLQFLAERFALSHEEVLLKPPA